MNRGKIAACRLILWIAARIVPDGLRAEWADHWQSDLWRWMLREADAEVPGSHAAVYSQARDAFEEAFRARFLSDTAADARRHFWGDPRIAIGAGALFLLSVAAFSGGFANTRQLLRGLPYPDSNRVIILAQGAPTFGARFGFRAQEIELFRAKSQTLAGLAEYTWHTRTFTSSNGKLRSVLTASVGPRFFPLLGVDKETPGSGEFLISNKFWRSELRSDPAAIGHLYMVDGRPMKLVGVLPEEFSFLSAPIAIWTAESSEPPPVLTRQWWVSLKGAVGRLNADAPPWVAEKEMRDLQMKSGIARRNFAVHATPVADLVYQSISSYGWDLGLFTGALLLVAIIRAWIDRRRGVGWGMAARFWGFFLLKTMLPVLALFFSIFEFGGAGRLGMTGGTPGRGGPMLTWTVFAVAVIMITWAWRDQPSRCRVCLSRMQLPVRIGITGLVLLETSGEEVMCPKGHGSVYTAESVLGADFSDRWMGVENLFAEHVKHSPGDVLGIEDRDK
ncbi:MAG: hypothetical protein ABL995_15955 [Bryobacteraceae bacterium]